MEVRGGSEPWALERQVAVQVAQDVLDLLARTGAAARASRPKGRLDEVTQADLQVEELTRERLALLTPGVPVVGEEGGGSPAGRTYWLVDPIDGTVNFARDHPFHAFSLALVEERVPVVGVLALPALGHVHVSGPPAPAPAPPALDVEAMVVAVGGLTPRHDGAGNTARLQVMQELHRRAYRLRVSGSLAADLLAAARGWVDAAVAFAPQTWDVAAGVAVARSEGLHVLNAQEEDYRLGDDLAVAAPHRDSARALCRLVSAATATAASPAT